jgi:hypothetical protein
MLEMPRTIPGGRAGKPELKTLGPSLKLIFRGGLLAAGVICDRCLATKRMRQPGLAEDS